MDTNTPPPPSQLQELTAASASQDENQEELPTANLPLASLSLSLFSPFPKPCSVVPSPSHVKFNVPSQVSSLSLSLFPPPAKSSSKLSAPSNISNSLLLSPSPFLRRRPTDPSAAAAARRCTIVWFRADLRLHDNEPLSAANADSLSILPVFLFDPRDFGRSPSGFDRTGPYRARFLIDSVAELRQGLRRRGSDLVVRIGRPEVVLPELARAAGADAVYSHREVSHDEARAEERVAAAMEAEGVEVKYFWGSTLYHIDDLPFKLEHMPTNYGGFREKVKVLTVRKTIETPEEVKGVPSRGNIEPGDIPSLQDLGLNPAPTMSQDGKPIMSASLVGGETEALERLKKFAIECRTETSRGNMENSRNSIFGANFSCKISPWLAMGCLSPRLMFEELKKTANRTVSAASSAKSGGLNSPDSGMNWLMFELLWRDFFRFITKKYSSAKKGAAAPATACTGALV
ncbi:blue-light photoreceptor PHR2-like [Zingiber officinale]|uniref:blue-light photoreceptor PHR2-like n=1 Tax=Zingiber officinale TaxID=94328 RepID=UPI001C4B8029|nr:blue-light photoreceptor PHR2-like [Zingiber officinale]